MRLLLDTHIYLWAVASDPLLSPETRRFIESADAVYVSAASIWEIAIKARLGKLAADPDALASAIESSGFLQLPISVAHAAGVARLPPHHNDPFDRLLLSQAVTEPLRLLTADALLARYGAMVLPV
ncbi:MAG TPA: type II toxin-antitoxin system VapC family toxin [Rubrivivax sp.]|nr:type II toxin-antitoxin system VapC family toxin [Rubrivivax sp.]